MKKTLPASVLLALGLTAGCRECGSTHVGPCLSVIPVPPPSTPDGPDVMPCLSIEPDPDTGVGPCLEYVPDPDPDEEPPPEPSPEEEDADPDGGAMLLPSRSEAAERVLAQGVLPEDVVAMLRERQET